MTYRPPIPPPSRADRTRFPAAVAAGLLALLAVQWWLPRPFDLPEPATLRPFRLPPVAVPPTAPAPAAARPIFAPARGGAAPAPAPPVGGAVAAGVAVRGGRPTAFLLRPDGRVAAVVPGATVAGWRLVGIGTAGLRFRRNGETATLPFGGGTAAPAADRQ